MIFHLLTAVLFLLKVLGIISISWWLVAAPSLLALGVILFFLFVTLLGALWAAWAMGR